MRPLLFALAVLTASSCITPRSMTLGQLASPVGRGATEVGVFSGVQISSQTQPPQPAGTDSAGNALTNQSSTSGTLLPGTEANVQHGFNERFALNVHASPAGLQPGLKWTINRSRTFHFALLPAVALGFGSAGTNTLQAGKDGVQNLVATNSQNALVFLGGLKVLFSHRSGFYAGLGYDFLFSRYFNQTGTSVQGVNTKIAALTTSVQHQVMAAIGFDIPLGMVHLRPEIAFALTPFQAATWTKQVDGNPSEVNANGGGYGFAILPGFSIAVASPAKAPDPDEVEEDTGKGRDKDPEGEDDDEDEKPRARKKKPAPLSDDEKEDRPKSRRRPASEDED